MALNLNEKTRGKLGRFIDNESAETVNAIIAFLRALDAAERIFAGEWLQELDAERQALAEGYRDRMGGAA